MSDYFEVRAWHSIVPLGRWDESDRTSPWSLSKAEQCAREHACERGVWRVDVVWLFSRDTAWITMAHIGPLGCWRARRAAASAAKAESIGPAAGEQNRQRAVEWLRAMRIMRGSLTVVVALSAAIGIRDALDGSLLVFWPMACIVALTALMCRLTRTIRQLRSLARPRPDYAAIARMEREIFGEEGSDA